jgi:hypothetical protein
MDSPSVKKTRNRRSKSPIPGHAREALDKMDSIIGDAEMVKRKLHEVIQSDHSRGAYVHDRAQKTRKIFSTADRGALLRYIRRIEFNADERQHLLEEGWSLE